MDIELKDKQQFLDLMEEEYLQLYRNLLKSREEQIETNPNDEPSLNESTLIKLNSLQVLYSNLKKEIDSVCYDEDESLIVDDLGKVQQILETMYNI